MGSSRNQRRRKKKQKLLVRNIEAQRNRCAFCLVEFRDHPKRYTPTLDHVEARTEFITYLDDKCGNPRVFIPLEADSYANTVAACWQCNNLRGDIPAFVFYHQQLWKPDNRKQRMLWTLTMCAKRDNIVTVLKRMVEWHVDCEKGWPSRVTDDREQLEKSRAKVRSYGKS